MEEPTLDTAQAESKPETEINETAQTESETTPTESETTQTESKPAKSKSKRATATKTAKAPPVKSDTKKTKKPAKKDSPKRPSKATHPKYSVMVKEALLALKDRNGSSRQAILKYVVANYTLPYDAKAINQHLGMTLRAGVLNGSLKQSKGSGASGSFKLADTKPAPKPKKAEPEPKKKEKAAKPKKKSGKTSKVKSSPKKSKAKSKEVSVKKPVKPKSIKKAKKAAASK